MRFTYDGTGYELVEPTMWTTLEAAQLQRYTDMHPLDLWRDFQVGGGFGVHSVMWVTLRRSGIDIAWGDLNVPLFDTVKELRTTGIEPGEPPDPSTASTRPPSASRGRRQPSARSAKK
jgi:hypothetical protein